MTVPARQSQTEAAMRRLAEAGPVGLPLAEVGAGTAHHVKMVGWAEIKGERAFATSRGVAFVRRGAFA